MAAKSTRSALVVDHEIRIVGDEQRRTPADDAVIVGVGGVQAEKPAAQREQLAPSGRNRSKQKRRQFIHGRPIRILTQPQGGASRFNQLLMRQARLRGPLRGRRSFNAGARLVLCYCFCVGVKETGKRPGIRHAAGSPQGEYEV